MARKLTYSVGDKFWKLTIIEILPAGPLQRRRAIFRCECGGVKEIKVDNVKSGATKSCGCLSNVSHRHTPKGIPSPTYSSWQSMLGRCYYPANYGYKFYGAKGVSVCDRWRFGDGDKGGFECFLADAGMRPSLEYSIDRIDNSLGYVPGNVRWATRREQARNQTTRKLFHFRGKKLTLTEIAEITNFPYERLRHRVVRAGWDLETAIAAPFQPGRRGKGSSGR